MQQLTIDKKELYSLINQAVREVLQEELFRLQMEKLPVVSKEEMEEIERTYDKPGHVRDIAYGKILEV